MPINIPNALTLLRILLIPVLAVVFYLPFQGHLLVAAGIFTLAAVTDWFDGYLARRLGQMTPFGAFLDPVADKLMVAVALVLLVERHDTPLFTLAACPTSDGTIATSAARRRRSMVARCAGGSAKRGRLCAHQLCAASSARWVCGARF